MSEEKHESDLKLDGLTRDELKKIEKSMKKPQFMGLLNEYMIEISDPKIKNEYDEYLRQMEREKELPKNMKLVELKPITTIEEKIGPLGPIFSFQLISLFSKNIEIKLERNNIAFRQYYITLLNLLKKLREIYQLIAIILPLGSIIAYLQLYRLYYYIYSYSTSQLIEPIGSIIAIAL